MSLFGALVRGYLVQRLLHPRRPRRGPYGHGSGRGVGPGYEAYRYDGYGQTPYRGGGSWPGGHRPVGPWPAGRPARASRRGRVRVAPIPHYSRTTRRGTRVSVGGCCLPIPLLVLAATATTAVGAARRVAGRSVG